MPWRFGQLLENNCLTLPSIGCRDVATDTELSIKLACTSSSQRSASRTSANGIKGKMPRERRVKDPRKVLDLAADISLAIICPLCGASSKVSTGKNVDECSSWQLELVNREEHNRLPSEDGRRVGLPVS